MKSKGQLGFRVLTILGVALALLPARRAAAVPIAVDLGPSHVTWQTPASSFDTLNGTGLAGQTLSLDFSFSRSEFARIFSITSSTFEAALSLQTNGTGVLGYLDGTGYLVDSNGHEIPGFGITGSASGDGTMALGLFPLLMDNEGTPNTGLLRPFDFYGVHFDLLLPNLNDPLVHVTGGTFTLVSNPSGVFGVGPGVPRDVVPEGGSTLLLLGAGLAGLAAVRLLFP